MVSGFFTLLYYVFLFCLVSSLVTRFVRLTKLYLSVILHKRLATLISTKRGVPYSAAISHIRCKLRFSILKSTLTAIRGYRGTIRTWGDGINSDINLIPQERQFF